MNNPYHCPTRREFLKASGVALTTITLGGLFPGRVLAADTEKRVGVRFFDTVEIGSIQDLVLGEPLSFSYGGKAPFNSCFLIKTGRRSGGGIGPDQDVVAFSNLCTHMGMNLTGQYNADHAVVGPCPMHLTTFDLTRHGMVVSGHGTESLPQVVLEAQGDLIVATGIIGLIHGLSDAKEMI